MAERIDEKLPLLSNTVYKGSLPKVICPKKMSRIAAGTNQVPHAVNKMLQFHTLALGETAHGLARSTPSQPQLDVLK